MALPEPKSQEIIQRLFFIFRYLASKHMNNCCTATLILSKCSPTIKKSAHELFRLLGYYAAWGGLQPTFRDYLSVPFSSAKLSLFLDILNLTPRNNGKNSVQTLWKPSISQVCAHWHFGTASSRMWYRVVQQIQIFRTNLLRPSSRYKKCRLKDSWHKEKGVCKGHASDTELIVDEGAWRGRDQNTR
jgi:hypothetical protein